MNNLSFHKIERVESDISSPKQLIKARFQSNFSVGRIECKGLVEVV